MDKIIIEGGYPLRGDIRISGAKNGALPLIAATLLSEGRCVLRNVPDLKDIRTLAEILREVGLSVEKSAPNTFVTQLVSEENSVARYELVSQMRASIVGNRAEGRRSHQIFEVSSIIPSSISTPTVSWYSDQLLKCGGRPVRGRLSNTVSR